MSAATAFCFVNDVPSNDASTVCLPAPGGWGTCHACEASYRRRALAKGEKLLCSRCGELLAHLLPLLVELLAREEVVLEEV